MERIHAFKKATWKFCQTYFVAFETVFIILKVLTCWKSQTNRWNLFASNSREILSGNSGPLAISHLFNKRKTQFFFPYLCATGQANAFLHCCEVPFFPTPPHPELILCQCIKSVTSIRFSFIIWNSSLFIMSMHSLGSDRLFWHIRPSILCNNAFFPTRCVLADDGCAWCFVFKISVLIPPFRDSIHFIYLFNFFLAPRSVQKAFEDVLYTFFTIAVMSNSMPCPL